MTVAKSQDGDVPMKQADCEADDGAEPQKGDTLPFMVNGRMVSFEIRSKVNSLLFLRSLNLKHRAKVSVRQWRKQQRFLAAERE